MMAASGKPAEEHAPNGNQIMDDGHGVQVQPSPGKCVFVEGLLMWKVVRACCGSYTALQP